MHGFGKLVMISDDPDNESGIEIFQTKFVNNMIEEGSAAFIKWFTGPIFYGEVHTEVEQDGNEIVIFGCGKSAKSVGKSFKRFCGYINSDGKGAWTPEESLTYFQKERAQEFFLKGLRNASAVNKVVNEYNSNQS